MSSPQQASVHNRLLKHLSVADFALLQPHLQPLETVLHQTLIAPRVAIAQLFFPESGYVSVTTDRTVRRIEVGLIGREGLAGAYPVLLGVDTAPYHEFVQCPGEVLAISTSAFRSAIERSPSLRGLMLRYLQTKLVQAREAAFVNAAYNMEARLARWLLMCHDRLDGDEIPVTHELLSVMLGVQRSGATLAVQTLEGAALIKARRGRITMRNREGLIALANGSYGTPEAEYERLIETPEVLHEAGSA